MNEQPLPGFTDHDAHSKMFPLEASTPPDATIVEWLVSIADERDRPRIKILDVGCGRGATVAWLLEQGWDAFGIDVDSRYVENGADYVTRLAGENRLRLFDGSAYPFEDVFFDLVISDQVVEHVKDLRAFTAEVARVTRPGGRGLHVFPAKWLHREPHMLTPLVHWFPKGRTRRAALRLALRTGHAAPYFQELSLAQRVQIFYAYSEEQTFYRSTVQVIEAFSAAGLMADPTSIVSKRVRSLLPWLPNALQPIAIWAYRTLRVMYLATVKT